MAQRIPRTLTTKRAALALERSQLKARQSQIEAELQALDFALKVVSSTRGLPKLAPQPQKRALLSQGQVASTCLQLRRKHGEMPTRTCTGHLAPIFVEVCQQACRTRLRVQRCYGIASLSATGRSGSLGQRREEWRSKAKSVPGRGADTQKEEGPAWAVRFSHARLPAWT